MKFRSQRSIPSSLVLGKQSIKPTPRVGDAGAEPIAVTYCDPAELDAMREDVRQLRGQADTVILSCHWVSRPRADEPFVPGDPGSLPQGAHRHERAHRYFAEGQAVAARLGIPCAWSLIEVPGVAHDGKRMAEAAAPVLAAALHR